MTDDPPFLGMASERDVGFTKIICRFARMFCAIKDEDFAHDRLGRDEIWILGHVTRSVDFARVVDGLNDLHSRFGRRMSTNLCSSRP